jgi:transposase
MSWSENMAKSEQNLTKMQLEAAALMVLGSSAVAVAKKLKVGTSSIYRWARLPAFKAQLEAGRKEVFSQAVGALKAASGTAVDRLVAIMKAEDLAEARRAATTILELGFRAKELDEFEARILALEAHLAGQGLLYEVSEAFLPATDQLSAARPGARSQGVKKSDARASE